MKNSKAAPLIEDLFTLRVIGLAALLRYLSVALHEASHWAVLSAYGRYPRMGFTKLAQNWDPWPREAEKWIQITLGERVGWLPVGSVSEGGSAEALALAAGCLVTLLLAWIGCFLFYCASSRHWQTCGFLLALVNGVELLPFFESYFLDRSDAASLAWVLGISRAWIVVPYELLRLAAAGLTLAAAKTWNLRIGWFCLGGVIRSGVDALLRSLDMVILEGTTSRSLWLEPLWGWPPFILILHGLAGATLVWIWWKRARLKPQPPSP